MKQYTAQEIKFYKKLFEEFIDRDLLNSQLKAKEYARFAEIRGDDAFVALFQALEHDRGPKEFKSRESREKAIEILEPWYKGLFDVAGFEFYISYYAALLMSIADANDLRVCDEILRKYPDSFQALTSKGIILTRRAKYQEAIESFYKALAIRPGSPWTLKHLARALSRVKFAEADVIPITKVYTPHKSKIQSYKVKRKNRIFNYKVFLGHSKPASTEISVCLKNFLENFFPGMEAFCSDEDIAGGKYWYSKILKELDNSVCGVFCFTKQNTKSKWMHFEAGALSLPSEKERIIPLLFNIVKGKLEEPLTNSQCVNQSKKGILKLLKGINENINNEDKYTEKELETRLDNYWKRLQQEFQRISKKYKL